MEYRDSYFKESDLILIYAPGENKKLIYFEGGLDKSDTRIHKIPLSITKCNYSNAIKSYSKLISVYINIKDKIENFELNEEETKIIIKDKKIYYNIEESSPLTPIDKVDFENYLNEIKERSKKQENIVEKKPRLNIINKPSEKRKVSHIKLYFTLILIIISIILLYIYS